MAGHPRPRWVPLAGVPRPGWEINRYTIHSLGIEFIWWIMKGKGKGEEEGEKVEEEKG